MLCRAIVVFEDLAHLDRLCVSGEDGWLSDRRSEVKDGLAVRAYTEGLSAPEVLPLGRAWKVDIAFSGSCEEGWSDQNVFTEHEFGVFAPGSGIVWEMHHERPRERTTQVLSLFHQVHLVVAKLNMDLNELLEEVNRVYVVVDLVLGFGDVRRVRSQHWVRESVHLDPALQSLFTPRVLHESDSELFLNNRRVAANIRMSNSGSAHTSVHEADERRLQAIIVIQSRQLISHPVQASVLRALASSSTHEEDNVFTVINHSEGLRDYLRPVLRVLVVILDWVRSVIQDCIERQVLAEVVHPATPTSFVYQVVLDD